MASTSATKPVIVIVPGSFSTTASYADFIPYITSAGYSFIISRLPSANDGTIHPAPTMFDDAAAIRSVVLQILDEQHRNAVVMMHSYGGFPGNEALEGLSPSARGEGETAVTGLLFMCAAVPIEGESRHLAVGEQRGSQLWPEQPGQYMAYPTKMTPVVYNDISDQSILDRLEKCFCHQSLDAFAGKVSYSAWRDIPSVYVSGAKDALMSPARQTELVRRAQEQGARMEMMLLEDAGHCPCLSRPEKVIEALIMAAGF